MSALALGLCTLAAMALIARRAERSLAPDQDRLPMNFALDGTVLRTAPRRVALWFMPALAVTVFVPLALVAQGTPGALVAAISLLGGQLFYHELVRRAA